MTRLQRIMKRAWEIAKEAVKDFGGKVKEYLSESLKMAWAEVKEVRYTIEDLEAMGARRWTKAGYDRLYLNKAGLKLAGLELSRYNTGNISFATLNGEKISNTKGGEISYIVGKAFIDLTTGIVNILESDNMVIQEAIANLRNNLKLA